MTVKAARGQLDLYRQVLDHVLVDCDGLPCGTIDEIEASGELGEPLQIEALLVGPGAWARRLPALFQALARLAFGTRTTRVPWREVAEIGEQIKLRSSAQALGLGVVDRRIGRWLAHLPGAEKAPE